jgi:glutaredoxin
MHGPQILSVGHNTKLLTHRHVLLTNAGYEVTSAALPVKAMNLLSTRSFDLILVGVSAHAERILVERAQEGIQVPVIFLCCENFDPSLGVCTCQNAELGSEELLQKIAEVLSGSQTH